MEAVLIIEKNKKISDAISEILTGEGCHTDRIDSDKGAVEKIKDSKFDLVVRRKDTEEDRESPLSYVLLAGYGERVTPFKSIEVGDKDLKDPIELEAFLKDLKSCLHDYRTMVRSKKLFKRQKESLIKILKIIIEAIEVHGPPLEGHSTRVTERALKIADVLGMTEERKQILEWAGYLHDIGSATTRLSILHKTEKLVEEESEQLKALPVVAHELLSPLNDLKEVAKIIYHKSEKFDGTGYPDGLKGNEIPEESKIINIAEVYDSLTNPRPYRPSFSQEEAFKIIEESSGSKYDPKIIEVFLDTFSDEYEYDEKKKKKMSVNEQARMLVTIGDSYRAMGSYSDALEAYSECIDLTGLLPNHMIDALLGLSSLHLCQYRYTQAKIMAEAAKEKAKEISILKEGQVDLILGLILGIQGDISRAEELLNGAFNIFEEWNYKELSLQSRLNLARVYAGIYKKQNWDEEKFKETFRIWIDQINENMSGNIFFKDMIIVLPVLLVAYTMEEFKDQVGLFFNKIDNLRKEIETIKWELPEEVKFALVDWIKVSGKKGFPMAQYLLEDKNEEVKEMVSRVLEGPEPEISVVTRPSDYPLMVYGFGVPRIFLKDELVADKKWKTRKSKLLFLYLLAQSNQKVPEDKIVDLFWADSSMEKARQNLYNAVYHIRKVLGSDLGVASKSVILIKHSTYQLNPAIKSWYDVNEFEKLHNAGLSKLDRGSTGDAVSDFKVAVEFYKGRFLEIYYDDWVVNYGYQLQEKLIYMLKELSAFYLREGEYQSSITCAQRILEEDPCEQDAYYIIMNAYFNLGKPEQVIKQYLMCCQTLQEEMDITPSQKIKDIYMKAKSTEQ